MLVARKQAIMLVLSSSRIMYEGKSCGARAQLSSAGLTKRMTNTRLGNNHQKWNAQVKDPYQCPQKSEKSNARVAIAIAIYCALLAHSILHTLSTNQMLHSPYCVAVVGRRWLLGSSDRVAAECQALPSFPSPEVFFRATAM